MPLEILPLQISGRLIGKGFIVYLRYVNFFQERTFVTYLVRRAGQSELNGSTRQPNLEQIQPIRENTDPLNVQIGNPNLKQEFRHNISFNYNNYGSYQQVRLAKW
jgi:hypothetical protein